MTVSSIVPVNNYTGNSSTKIFDFDFLIENEKELVVQHKDKNGIISILQYGVDYSINEIGNKNGSYIEFPLNGSTYGVLQPDEQISLALSLQIKQESEFHNSSYFNLDVLEWTFDYIVRILQILNRKIERCVKVEESNEIYPDEIINELNDKYEKVNSTYSQIVGISKDIEENKNISIQQTNLSLENAEIAKTQAEVAKQKAKEAGLIIGEKIAIFSSNDYVPECCLPCDGAIYNTSEFKDFYDNYISENNPLLSVCSFDEYDTDILTSGQCSKFAVDPINGSFRVPLIIDEKIDYFVVVANGQTNQSMMDWSAWASSLQGKANTDLSNVDKVSLLGLRKLVEVSDTSLMPSWYKVFEEIQPDGSIKKWCEQGSVITPNSTGTATYNYAKPFADDNYLLFKQYLRKTTATDSASQRLLAIYKVDATSYSNYDVSGSPYSWQAMGYIN